VVECVLAWLLFGFLGGLSSGCVAGHGVGGPRSKAYGVTFGWGGRLNSLGEKRHFGSLPRWSLHTKKENAV